MAAKTFKQGDTYNYQDTLVDENGDPINLATPQQVFMYVYKAGAKQAPQYSREVQIGYEDLAVTGADNNEVSVWLTRTQTAVFAKGLFDVVLVVEVADVSSPSGVKITEYQITGFTATEGKAKDETTP